jgi:hypothetical protein
VQVQQAVGQVFTAQLTPDNLNLYCFVNITTTPGNRVMLQGNISVTLQGSGGVNAYILRNGINVIPSGSPGDAISTISATTNITRTMQQAWIEPASAGGQTYQIALIANGATGSVFVSNKTSCTLSAIEMR